jgi:hypothetical protein
MTVGAGTECGVLRDNSLDVYGADGETPMAGREFEVIECQPDALAVRCHDLMREQANRLPSMPIYLFRYDWHFMGHLRTVTALP